MRALCLQENLKNAFNLASRNVASQPQLPILANLFLKAAKNKIRISATNLSLGLNLWLDAKIEEEGEITVPAKIISEFVNSLSPGQIKLQTDKEKLLLSAGKFTASFNGLPSSEFPPLPNIEKIKKEKKDLLSFEFSLSEFAQAISQTAFAAATDEGRPVLTGVLWQIAGSLSTFVATDGYRLSLRRLNLPNKSPDAQFIIPASALEEIIRNQSEKDLLTILIVPGAKQVIFGLPQLEIFSQLLEGEYPDFRKIIPQSSDTKIILDREELLQAVQVAAIFARESANILRLKIEKAQLKISANTPQVGENENTLDTQKSGPDSKIAFNARFVLDFLKSTTAPEVEILMTAPTSPAIFRPAKDLNYQHVIMPVRLQEEEG